MKNLLLPFFTLLISVGAYAQYAGGGTPNAATAGGQGNALTTRLLAQMLGPIDEAEKKRKDIDISTIEGSPYSFNNFNSTVLFYGEEKVGQIYYRYNAYNEEVEVKQQNMEAEPIRALGKDKKIHVVIKGKPMSFKTFINKKGITKNGYLTLLKDGTYKLYHHLGVSFKEGKKAENSFVQSKPAKFLQNDEYYLQDATGKKIAQVEFKNKKVLELASSNHKKALQEFLSTKKIKVKTVNDLYQVIDFLNNLN